MSAHDTSTGSRKVQQRQWLTLRKVNFTNPALLQLLEVLRLADLRVLYDSLDDLDLLEVRGSNLGAFVGAVEA